MVVVPWMQGQRTSAFFIPAGRMEFVQAFFSPGVRVMRRLPLLGKFLLLLFFMLLAVLAPWLGAGTDWAWEGSLL
ncbi:hypothetical protein ACQV5M_21690, partial [Leptospira sp. SA-E8]|uniref:hypothetical protein n=1 Tax=Leptospira sp. SA-E8 TaxID=3422259 RepID=UPI003EB80221